MKYKTKTKLILPFKITLMISNGGRLPETNKAIALPAQFEKINVNGTEKEFYEPVRFEQVSNLK